MLWLVMLFLSGVLLFLWGCNLLSWPAGASALRQWAERVAGDAAHRRRAAR